MAIVMGQSMLRDIRGTLGGELVFRRYGDRTVVGVKGRKRRGNSVRQQLSCDRFKAAAAYARVLLRDPDKRAFYKGLARKLGKHSAYNLIISQYMRGVETQPMVTPSVHGVVPCSEPKLARVGGDVSLCGGLPAHFSASMVGAGGENRYGRRDGVVRLRAFPAVGAWCALTG